MVNLESIRLDDHSLLLVLLKLRVWLCYEHGCGQSVKKEQRFYYATLPFV
jgi:hypothetical protein